MNKENELLQAVNKSVKKTPTLKHNLLSQNLLKKQEAEKQERIYRELSPTMKEL
ncbi:hypothetical protein ACIXC0_22085 [Bacteroides fragilis]